MADERSSELLEGALVAGKLRIVRRLGSGGMASVYEVEHTITKTRCALKLLHHKMLRPDVVARFLREASAAGHIGNPHIVQTLDAGTLESGEPYIVMELLEGESLAERLAHAPRLEIGELVTIVRQAAGAIEAAHRAGIVHRDLKPDNLYLSSRDGAIFVKVLDFGISKFDATATGATGLTQEGALLGTPHYMAPEQIRGEVEVDARADVYALGVILYECVAGRRPFDADTLTALAVQIHEGKPPPLSTLRPDLPAALGEVIARAMNVAHDARFASANELRDALAPFESAPEALALAKTEVSLPPPSAVSKTAATATPKRLRRIAVVAAAAIGGVGWLSYGLMRQHRPGAPAAPPVPHAGDRPTGMTLVRGGTYALGETHAKVSVGDFFFDISEVTVEAYRACVAAGKCTPANADDPRCNGEDRLFHPVNCIDFAQANAFCAAYQKRLPTEAEWEWAARGGEQARMYPWGNEPPAARACWNGAGNDSGEGKRTGTCVIGKFLNGTSANEVHDLAGNVWEWTSTMFEGTNKRVVRGGSWHSLEPERLTASYRFRREPDERDFVLGFRCARDLAVRPGSE